MGMYTELMETSVEVKRPLKFKSTNENVIETVTFWVDWLDKDKARGEGIKFYGYWGKDKLNELHHLAEQGLISGEATVKYEEGDIIGLRFTPLGFFYSMGEVVFKEWKQ